ncbi:hypothetical protein FJY90_02945 [Candidatus Gottesmanbacteria bacterium]|nr:hypothetical protein [Candidatus Gottesmanbacteria bacterium]
MVEQLAQRIKLPDGTEIYGPLPTLTGPGGGDKFTNLASLVNNAVPYVFSISGIVLLLYLVWGGFNYLTSMGDPKKAESAKGKITNAIIGFVIIFVAYWLVQIIDYLFHLGVYK